MVWAQPLSIKIRGKAVKSVIHALLRLGDEANTLFDDIRRTYLLANRWSLANGSLMQIARTFLVRPRVL